MTLKESPSLDRKIEELLNRKPNKWGNVPIKAFEQDIGLLQKVVMQQREQIHKLESEK